MNWSLGGRRYVGCGHSVQEQDTHGLRGLLVRYCLHLPSSRVASVKMTVKNSLTKIAMKQSVC